MDRTTLIALLLVGAVGTLVANEETTYLVPQPIVAFGDAEDWTATGKLDTDEMYMILGMAYFQKHNHGPVYAPIAASHLMANSDSGGGPLRDCNLLSLCGISITHDPLESKSVFLNLDHAKADKNSVLSLEVAVYAALECIRIVADRYHHDITLQIAPPKNEPDKWIELEKAFNKHDKARPFKKQNKPTQGNRGGG